MVLGSDLCWTPAFLGPIAANEVYFYWIVALHQAAAQLGLGVIMTETEFCENVAFMPLTRFRFIAAHYRHIQYFDKDLLWHSCLLAVRFIRDNYWILRHA